MTVRSWDGEVLVNTNTANSQSFSKVVALANGGWVVAWMDNDPVGGDGSGSCVKFQLFDASGAKVGAELIANSGAAGFQSFPDVVATDGGFTIAWEDSNGGAIEYRRFDPNGAALDPSDVVLSSANVRSDAQLATNGNQFLIAYTENVGGDDNVLVQRIVSGNPSGLPISVAATVGDENQSAIAELAGGGFAVAWHVSGTDHVLIRGFNAAGAQAFGAEDVAALTDVAQQPTITALANGSFVVAWQVTNPIFPDLVAGSIRARVVAADGTLEGSEFTVNTLTTGIQSAPSLAALPTGGFVAVYESSGDIRGQVFDDLGSRVGAEFIANTSTANGQFIPDVTVLADGRFVVTWDDGGAGHADDPSPDAIRQQIFDPRDGVVTGTANADNLFGHNLGSDDIKGLGGSDTLHGLGGDDALYGGDGNDVLIGGTGADLLFGGFGDDTYQVADAGDQVSEGAGAGIDLVLASVSFTLAANVENLTLLAGAANGTGNALANIITGNAAANVLDGQAGADRMIGLGGNDTYVVNNTGDVVDETGGGGIDTVQSSTNFSLVASTQVIGALENLTLTGSAAIYGIGNGLANVITGNAGANTLVGNAGNDTISCGLGSDTVFGGTGNDTITAGLGNTAASSLSGEAGNDTITGARGKDEIHGGTGNDTLAGGLGNDQLTGGAGFDKFVFDTRPSAANRDLVVDFINVQDTFLLDNAVFTKLGGNGPLKAGFFHAGAAAADADDHIIYDKETGALIYDANGNAAGGAVQFATLYNRPALLLANDFVVI